MLDQLEAKKREAFATLRASKNIFLDAQFSRLEEQMNALYKWAIQQSKEDLSVQEVFYPWDKTVSVCDFFIDYFRDTLGSLSHSTSFDGLLDVRLACDENREFHRC